MSENLENLAENTETETAAEPSPSFLRRQLMCYLGIVLILLIGVSVIFPSLFLQHTHKPAIYLYAEKPTAVTVKLDTLLK